MLTNKRKLLVDETMALTEECSAIIKQMLPPKLKDPRSFIVLYSIGNSHNLNALIDSGASINLMLLSIYRKLGLDDSKATSIILQLADRTFKHPYGMVDNLLIKFGDHYFPDDFIILNIDAQHIPLILRRPFLATARALINFEKDELILRVEEKQQIFTMNGPLKQPVDIEKFRKIYP
ncbi:unnamed protein product [Fraxinus pennsylvanica]|uniref:Uncharacterized protein n=1 Tax=Fraxinus pennsylvanica TaxID=56036 RepID=A0AAD1YTV6_9LAMI|nr:unnamed protein product [Fraxinus pennsylvanica]